MKGEELRHSSGLMRERLSAMTGFAFRWVATTSARKATTWALVWRGAVARNCPLETSRAA